MLTEKKILPVFNVFISEDLTKEAFIHWTDFDGKRRRIKGGLNRFRTLEERRAAAAVLVAKLEAEYVPPLPVAMKNSPNQQPAKLPTSITQNQQNNQPSISREIGGQKMAPMPSSNREFVSKSVFIDKEIVIW